MQKSAVYSLQQPIGKETKEFLALLIAAFLRITGARMLDLYTRDYEPLLNYFREDSVSRE